MEKCTSSSFDRISDLPSNITESILMFLPMRDMVRTSILSKKWRFQWVQVPELIFENDSEMFGSTEDTNADKLNIVVGVLFQHRGHIRKFKLDMSSWCSCYGIDKIFQYLSRNGIQELDLLMPRKEFHMPSSIYSCLELTLLRLKSRFKSKLTSVKPITLVGFNKLVTLELLGVVLDPHVTICDCPYLRYLILQPRSWVTLLRIDCPNLESLVINRCVTRVCIKKAPLLKVLALLTPLVFFLEKEIQLIEFLSSFPLLENLTLSVHYVESLARCSPNELPTMLNKLRMLRLTSIDLYVMDQLTSVLRLIKSFPNLQKLEFTESCTASQSQRLQCLQMPTSCDYSLMPKLREVKFELSSTDPRGYIDFFKFLLAVSPELETLYIKPVSGDIDLSCCKTLLKFACTRRASSKADIVFIGLDLDN